MAGPEDRLALIELVDRDGRVRRVADVLRWPLTVGRALDNDLVLDDPHVAPHHLSVALEPESGAPWLHVGETRNGVQVGPRTLMQGESCGLPAGSAMQIGGLRLRLRMPGDPLEPERPLGLAVTGARPMVTLASALAVWGLVLVEHAVDLDPGSSLTDWLVPLLAVPFVVVLWCLLWGTASKVFQHRFEFWAHFAILVKGLLVIGLLELLLPVLAFSLSWEWLSRITPSLCALVAAATLYRHAVLVLPLNRRIVAAGIGACVLLGAGVMGALEMQRSDRLFSEPYLATLPPPAFRLAPGISAREFIAESAALKAKLDKRARDDRPGGGEDDDD